MQAHGPNRLVILPHPNGIGSIELHNPGSRVASAKVYKPHISRDAVTWPQLRREMSDGQQLIRRMAYDLAVMVRDRGAEAVITTEDYLRLGWTRDQVRAHAVDAAGMLPEVMAAGLPGIGAPRTAA